MASAIRLASSTWWRSLSSPLGTACRARPMRAARCAGKGVVGVGRVQGMVLELGGNEVTEACSELVGDQVLVAARLKIRHSGTVAADAAPLGQLSVLRQPEISYIEESPFLNW